MKEIDVKQEAFQPPDFLQEREAIVRKQNTTNKIRSTSSSNGCSTIFLDADSSDGDDDWDFEGSPEKKPRILAALPVGFLDPLKPEERLAMQLHKGSNNKNGTFNASLMLNGQRDFEIKSIEEEEPLTTAVEGNGMSRGHLSKKSCSVKQFWKAGDYDGAGADATMSEAQSGNQCSLTLIELSVAFFSNCWTYIAK